jgi:hypothetical protein
MPVVPAGMQQN